MQSLRIILAGAAIITCASCERPSERSGERASDPFAAEAPSTSRNVGEGERETRVVDARAVVDQFAQHVANDPAIAAVSNAQLILTQGGEFVLQGTAESDDVKDGLEDYAEKLAGGDVRNEIEVADQ